MNFRDKIKSIKRVLLPNCREAVRAQSDLLDRPATLSVRLGLWLHLLLCKLCKRYGQQIRFLRTAAQNHCDECTEAAPQKLSANARERIKEQLRAKN